MQGISLLVVITPREYENAYYEFFSSQDITPVFSLFCEGTAGKSLLARLGLETTEKVLLFSLVPAPMVPVLMESMVSRLGLNMPGNGIAVSMPLGSIGGASSLKLLMEKQDTILGEVKNVEEKQTFPYELIIAVIQRGHTDMVMDAARSAGAGGGTILNAKGVGPEFASHFLGVSITSEKELLLIVTRREDRDAIMRAIMDQAGIRSQAHTALFSVPVDHVAGLRSVAKED